MYEISIDTLRTLYVQTGIVGPRRIFLFLTYADFAYHGSATFESE